MKLAALRAFGLALDPAHCRLYVDDDSEDGHVPRMFDSVVCLRCFVVLVYDHQPVDTIEFKQNSTNLCLKSGQALKENDILLTVQSDREPNSLELVVDINLTLPDVWNIIKEELRMDRKNCHAVFLSPEMSLLLS